MEIADTADTSVNGTIFTDSGTYKLTPFFHRDVPSEQALLHNALDTANGNEIPLKKLETVIDSIDVLSINAMEASTLAITRKHLHPAIHAYFATLLLDDTAQIFGIAGAKANTPITEQIKAARLYTHTLTYDLIHTGKIHRMPIDMEEFLAQMQLIIGLSWLAKTLFCMEPKDRQKLIATSKIFAREIAFIGNIDAVAAPLPYHTGALVEVCKFLTGIS